jgi:acyl-CoA synthetase (AMP-forming)/AMP-acid ligase II
MIFRSPCAEIEAPQGSIVDAVIGCATARGDRAAVIEGETGQTLSYRDLVEGSGRVAAGFAKSGVRPGDPVVVALPNSIDFVLTWFGALRAGAWVVPVSPLYTPEEIGYQIRDSGARHLVAVPDRAEALAAAVDRAFVAGCGENELAACRGDAVDVRRGPEDMAVLPYSSGTTGKPKGVILTHGNIVANMRQIEIATAAREGDVVVNMMPL